MQWAFNLDPRKKDGRVFALSQVPMDLIAAFQVTYACYVNVNVMVEFINSLEYACSIFYSFPIKLNGTIRSQKNEESYFLVGYILPGLM